MPKELKLKEKMLLRRLPKVDLQDKEFMDKLLLIREIFDGKIIDVELERRGRAIPVLILTLILAICAAAVISVGRSLLS